MSKEKEVKSESVSYKVSFKGYSETFSTMAAAEAQYEKSKKALARRRESFTLKLAKVSGSSSEVLQQCKVSDDAFEDE